jgi:hypothetical protein
MRMVTANLATASPVAPGGADLAAADGAERRHARSEHDEQDHDHPHPSTISIVVDRAGRLTTEHGRAAVRPPTFITWRVSSFWPSPHLGGIDYKEPKAGALLMKWLVDKPHG